MKTNFIDTIAGIDDANLDQLEAAVQQQREARRAKVDINDIKPGMSKDQIEKARAEINKVLTSLRG